MDTQRKAAGGGARNGTLGGCRRHSGVPAFPSTAQRDIRLKRVQKNQKLLDFKKRVKTPLFKAQSAEIMMQHNIKVILHEFCLIFGVFAKK